MALQPESPPGRRNVQLRHTVIFHNAATQCVMAQAQQVERLLQTRRIQRAAQTHAHGQVVGGGLGRTETADEPDAPLRCRERQYPLLRLGAEISALRLFLYSDPAGHDRLAHPSGC